MKNFVVYIIQSDSGKFYIGQTADLKDRLLRYNSNRSTFSKNKGTWNLVIDYQCRSRSDAITLELK